jgi:glyoxylase-like metal-dependent hydrolase (beta-lactamase superfamily II)
VLSDAPFEDYAQAKGTMMVEYTRKVQLGAVMVTVINVGDIQVPYDEWLNVSPEVRSTHDTAKLTGLVRMPIQCFHVALPGTSILVDASSFDFPHDHPWAIPHYQPPPGLLAGLAQVNVQPDEIAHVIITHGHFDHYNGTTRQEQGQHTPCFPFARHYLGRADWDQLQPQLQDPNSEASHTLAVLQRHRLLDLVEGDHDLSDGIQIISAPGETPGHQIVRVHVDEQTLYILGDLYHHTIEVEHPNWMVKWNDVDANYRSREMLMKAALREHALLFATHIPTVGRLQETDSGSIWEAV